MTNQRPEFTSFKELMDGWLARLKEKKAEERKFFQDGHPNTSNICFGHSVAVSICLEDLINLLDYFQKQSHDVHKELVATYLKYTSDGSSQGETSYENNSGDKKDEGSQKSSAYSIQEE